MRNVTEIDEMAKEGNTAFLLYATFLLAGSVICFISMFYIDVLPIGIVFLVLSIHSFIQSRYFCMKEYICRLNK